MCGWSETRSHFLDQRKLRCRIQGYHSEWKRQQRTTGDVYLVQACEVPGTATVSRSLSISLFNLLLSLLHLLVHPSHSSLFSLSPLLFFSIQVSPKPLFSIGEGTGTLPTIESINVSANVHELIQCDTGEGMEADVNVSITVDGIDSSGTSKSYYSFSCFIRV